MFIYGTLCDSNVQKSIIGRVIELDDDTLPGFIIEQIKINKDTYPIVVKRERSYVLGKTMQVSNGEIKKIDEYETKAYVRKLVSLKSGRTSWVYCK